MPLTVKQAIRIKELQYIGDLLDDWIRLITKIISDLPFLVTKRALDKLLTCRDRSFEFFTKCLELEDFVEENYGNNSSGESKELNNAYVETLSKELLDMANDIGFKIYQGSISVFQDCSPAVQCKSSIREELVKLINAHEKFYKDWKEKIAEIEDAEYFDLSAFEEKASSESSASFDSFKGQLSKLIYEVDKLKVKLFKDVCWSDVEPGGKLDLDLGTDGNRCSRFQSGKQLQHEIYAWLKRSKDFDQYIKTLETENKEIPKPPVISISTFLPKKSDYGDLILMGEILKPEDVHQALTNKLQVLKTFDKTCKSKIPYLRERLGRYFSEIIRLQRTIMAYEAFKDRLDKIDVNQISARQIESLLTYSYMAIFKRRFSAQTISMVIIDLEETLRIGLVKGENGKEIYQHFLKVKQNLQQEVKQKEELLKRQENWLSWFLAHISLVIENQTEYQAGAHFVSLYTDKEIPKALFGLILLVASLYFSGWYNYSYRFISLFARLLMTDLDDLIQLGEKFDNHFVRLDELGIIEKKEYIEWLAGLIMYSSWQTLFHNSSIRDINAILESWKIDPTFLLDTGRYRILFKNFYETLSLKRGIFAAANYTMATSCSSIFSRIWEGMLHKTDFHETTINFCKLIVHACSYLSVNSVAPKLGGFYFGTREVIDPAAAIKDAEGNEQASDPKLSEKTPTQLEAYNVLGVHASTVREGLRHRYRSLSKICHTDKSNSRCPNHVGDMTRLVDAANSLGLTSVGSRMKPKLA